ncbi:hypothetical protein CCUS01_06417, partial [Colletotrichum cuscutae]
WRLGSLHRFWSILRRLLSATQIRTGIVQPFTVCWFKRLRLHDLARPTSACIDPVIARLVKVSWPLFVKAFVTDK